MNEKGLLEPFSAQRAWWLRALLVLQAPTAVFEALRDESADDEDARGEPLVAVCFLAGIGGVLGTDVAGRLLDDPGGGWLVVIAWAMFAGALYALAAVFAGGLLLHWAARRLGGRGTWRRARHLFGFALAPLALGLLVLWPLRLALYGGDVFRYGGSDSGAGGARVLDSLWALCGAWSLLLLVTGIRAVYRWGWPRAFAAFGLTAAVPALLVLSQAL